MAAFIVNSRDTVLSVPELTDRQFPHRRDVQTTRHDTQYRAHTPLRQGRCYRNIVTIKRRLTHILTGGWVYGGAFPLTVTIKMAH